MNKTKMSLWLVLVASLLLLNPAVAGRIPDEKEELVLGPYPVGFELVQTEDPSRSFPAMGGSGFRRRPMRIYIWYPAGGGRGRPLTVGDFVHMAADDFALSADSSRPGAAEGRLPVPLRKGLNGAELDELLKRPTAAQAHLAPAAGEFPLLVVGQGLYYESPLSQVFLSEYLASRGYVVATCPLLGTQYRLVNRSVEDLETQVRDMEYVIAALRFRPEWRIRRLGVVGFDLGGMSGLILAMRHPEAEALLSLDCAILFPTVPTLPDGHPSYRENRFAIPWMHMTQNRFIEAGRADPQVHFLSDRKRFGDTWLVSVPSDCHGQFSSYARFGIKGPIPGYWGPVAGNMAEIHDGICRLAGDFFDATLKKDPSSAAALRTAGESGPFKIEHKVGTSAPSSSSLLHAISEKGLAAARPAVDRIRAADAAAEVMEQSELGWLAYHFLLWWGREDEALDLFRLNVELNPASADAHAGLGEACMILGRSQEAIASFRKALAIHPDLENVKAALDRLTKEK